MGPEQSGPFFRLWYPPCMTRERASVRRLCLEAVWH